MQIVSCKFCDIIQHKDFQALKQEYIQECANVCLPVPEEKFEVYQALDTSENLYCFMAIEGHTLYGFVVLICATLPHYGRLIAITESLFVSEQYRTKGAGLALIRKAEQCAKALGSPALIISAPLGGRLDKLLPRLQYRATNKAYTKEFSYE